MLAREFVSQLEGAKLSEVPTEDLIAEIKRRAA